MTIYKNLVTSCLLFSLLIFTLPASAAPFSKLVAFSGSLSDTGNGASISGDLPPPYVNNRNTNGPAAIDILAEYLGVSSAPSLHLEGKHAGSNYSALHASAAGDLPIDLPAQLDAYFAANGNISDPDALYFIFIGANDIVSAGIQQDEALSQQILQNGINEIENAFRKLHASGARTFLAPNNVDLGIAPIAIQFNVSERMTAKTIEFNRLFERKLRQLEQELKITIYRFDFFRFIDDMLTVTDIFNLTNTTDSCIALLDQGLCDIEKFAFINELLPTAKIHALFGNALVTSLMEQMSKSRDYKKFCKHSSRFCKTKGYSNIKLSKTPIHYK